MIRRLTLRLRAQTQIANAFSEWRTRDQERAEELLTEVDDAPNRISENPRLYARREDEPRRVNLRRFSYTVCYKAEDAIDDVTGQPFEHIIVFGSYHQRQNPASMRDEP